MPHRPIAAVALLLAALAPAAARAAEATYAIDPVHTRVMFAVSHAGFSNALGTFSGSTGTLVFDPDDCQDRARGRSRSRCSAWTSATRNGTPRCWRRISWTRRRIRSRTSSPRGSNRSMPTHATVFGNLTLRGVTREVRLDATFHQLKRHPLPPFHRTAGFSATANVQPQAVRDDRVAERGRRRGRIAHRSRSRAHRARDADDALPANAADRRARRVRRPRMRPSRTRARATTSP